MSEQYRDWGEASEKYDEIRYNLVGHDLSTANEAQTRFDVIDRIIREVLGWQYGQIKVEEPADRIGYVDYILRAGDNVIVIEAKKAGAAFPSPTRREQLKLSGSVLSTGEIGAAIRQVEGYAKSKNADVLVVTNGMCWCFYAPKLRTAETYATLLFPIDKPAQAETLFSYFAEANVEAGSLRKITNQAPLIEDRLLKAVKTLDGRVDRNKVADSIQAALDKALYADAILSDPAQLERVFVTTEARAKFDTTLGIHLADPKPAGIEPARRIRTGQGGGPLEELVDNSGPAYAPPVTVIIGPVGAGKSTYLKHFELVSGRGVLATRQAHWIYIDFEAMGPGGSPRDFMYRSLQNYIAAERPHGTLEYKTDVEAAYDEEIRALARGPLAPIFRQKDLFDQKIAEHILADYNAVEPYVDKVLGHLAKRHLCVIVLDNIDLYEDDKLETRVFAEGLALARRLKCSVIVSIRDETFVKHRNDSSFDAYELRKLWLDPPPLKSVISARLSYSKKILEKRSARIQMANGGITLNISDLSVFFEIVQRSILGAGAGDFIESMADGNIRAGLTLVRNFLTSGHIEADRALKTYLLEGDTAYTFPFHEIFKGTVLGQWRHFLEERAEAINIFDSRLGARRLRLLRMFLLNMLMSKAQQENTLEVPVEACVDVLGPIGVSREQVVQVLRFLAEQGLVRSVTAEAVDGDSTVVLTRSGAYYTKVLSRKFVYAEEVMFDTAIEDAAVWTKLWDLTIAVENEHFRGARMEARYERIKTFLDYLAEIENEALDSIPDRDRLQGISIIADEVLQDAGDAVRRARGIDQRQRSDSSV